MCFIRAKKEWEQVNLEVERREKKREKWQTSSDLQSKMKIKRLRHQVLHTLYWVVKDDKMQILKIKMQEVRCALSKLIKMQMTNRGLLCLYRSGIHVMHCHKHLIKFKSLTIKIALEL